MSAVPASLRRWFVVHFVADLIFAVPLVLAPGPTLRALGWTTIDPVARRLVGAALAGIGIESLIGRNDSVDAFRAMLRLKCIWSTVTVIGLALSINQGAPPMTWALLAIDVEPGFEQVDVEAGSAQALNGALSARS